MDDPSSSLVEVRNLHLSFGKFEAVKNISLSVKKGEVMSIIGPSGSGKSSLLRCINLLETPSKGGVRVGTHAMEFDGSGRRPRDRVLAEYRSRIGMVFQHFNLFPHMTVLENVMEGLVTVAKRQRKEAAEIAREVLAKVGLADKEPVFPGTLSGGEKQRVAIARALATGPEVMLFDEATSALDPELVGEVLSVMAQLSGQGMTMLIVTHEMSFARAVADRIVFMRDGSIVEEGPAAELIDDPKQESTRQFLQHFKSREYVRGDLRRDRGREMGI